MTRAFADRGRGSRLLITGGAGFVGGNLACAFRARYPELEVVSLDNLHRRGSELHLPRLAEARVRFVHGDVRNPEDLRGLGTFDALIECSAEPAVLAGYGPRRDYLLDTNLRGALHCVEAALDWGAALVFLSTSRVYPMAGLNGLKWEEDRRRYRLGPEQGVCGASESGISEDFPLHGARSLYGASKLCAELLILEYVELGLRAVINRCGAISGPWQMGKIDQGVAAYWLMSHRFGGKLDYIGYGGSGKQVRDFLHIDDLFDLLDLQLASLDRVQARTFNVGGGLASSLSLLELTELCQKLTGVELPMGCELQDRPGDVRIYITDNSRITEAIGWRPERSAAQILGDMNDWIDTQPAEIERALLI